MNLHDTFYKSIPHVESPLSPPERGLEKPEEKDLRKEDRWKIKIKKSSEGQGEGSCFYKGEKKKQKQNLTQIITKKLKNNLKAKHMKKTRGLGCFLFF